LSGFNDEASSPRRAAPPRSAVAAPGFLRGVLTIWRTTAPGLRRLVLTAHRGDPSGKRKPVRPSAQRYFCAVITAVRGIGRTTPPWGAVMPSPRCISRYIRGRYAHASASRTPGEVIAPPPKKECRRVPASAARPLLLRCVGTSCLPFDEQFVDSAAVVSTTLASVQQRPSRSALANRRPIRGLPDPCMPSQRGGEALWAPSARRLYRLRRRRLAFVHRPHDSCRFWLSSRGGPPPTFSSAARASTSATRSRRHARSGPAHTSERCGGSRPFVPGGHVDVATLRHRGDRLHLVRAPQRLAFVRPLQGLRPVRRAQSRRSGPGYISS